MRDRRIGPLHTHACGCVFEGRPNSYSDYEPCAELVELIRAVHLAEDEPTKNAARDRVAAHHLQCPRNQATPPTTAGGSEEP